MTAQAQLQELLEKLAIERVVVVDDSFLMSTTQAIVVFGEHELPQLDSLPPLHEDTDLETHLDQHWGGIDVADNVKAKRVARKEANWSAPDPTGLERLLRGPGFLGLTLFEWENGEAHNVMGRATRSLVLFDVDFSAETHTENDTTGLRLAAEALATRKQVVGLLTNKASVGEEEESASAWAKASQVPVAEFVIVNKHLLVDEDDENARQEAVEQIRTTLQAARIGRLRHKVREALGDGMDEVDDRLGADTPGVLEDVVFKASHAGGEWEGDTWFRIYAVLGLNQAKRAVAKDAEARTAVADVRELLRLRPPATQDSSKDLATDVVRAESYDDSDYVNGAGLPIANGDIFKSAGGTFFILVGQPCDLALRPDGRAYDPPTAILLPIKPSSTANKAPSAADPVEPDVEVATAPAGSNTDAAAPESVVDEGGEKSAFKLPEGGPMETGEWEVRFRPELHASFDVLDLCSLNTEGVATTKPAPQKALAPLLPGVAKRHEQILKAEAKAQKLLAHIDQMQEAKHLGAQPAKQLRLAVLAFSGPFIPTLNRKPALYDFGCQRVGRLAGTYADALLAAHANARSRTAHAHELTRIVHSD